MKTKNQAPFHSYLHLMEAMNSEIGDHEIVAENTATSRILNYYVENSRDAVRGNAYKNFSTKQRRLNITASDLVEAKTVGDMVEVVDTVKARADDQGI